MIDTQKYKKMLESELGTVEGELKTLGRRNPSNPQDWEAMPSKMDTDSADENLTADNIEEFESNTAILKQLETRFNEIRGALKRIEEGTYGKCEIGGEPIEEKRLEANPAATTCMKHMR